MKTELNLGWMKTYDGFESIDTLLDGTDIEDMLNFIVPNSEWTGRIIATFVYEEEDEE